MSNFSVPSRVPLPPLEPTKWEEQAHASLFGYAVNFPVSASFISGTATGQLVPTGRLSALTVSIIGECGGGEIQTPLRPLSPASFPAFDNDTGEVLGNAWLKLSGELALPAWYGARNVVIFGVALEG